VYKPENIVKLDNGNNAFNEKTETLLSLSSLSSNDMFSKVVVSSNHIGSRIVSKEDKSVSEESDWLKRRIKSSKLTANRKPGGEKQKRDDLLKVIVL
jgi:hypothetical protein